MFKNIKTDDRIINGQHIVEIVQRAVRTTYGNDHYQIVAILSNNCPNQEPLILHTALTKESSDTQLELLYDYNNSRY